MLRLMILPSYLSLIIFNTLKHGDRLEKTVQAVQIKKRVALPLTLPLNTIKLALMCSRVFRVRIRDRRGLP